MRKRPIVIWLVGLSLLLSPLYYYFEKCFVARLAWTDPAAVLGAMSLAKLIAIALGPIVGALVLMVRPISWYAIIGYSVYTVGANLALVLAGHMRLWVFALNVPTAILVILYFVRREVMTPYFNPRLRWWESDRVQLKTKAVITQGKRAEIDAETLDISPTGVFLVTDETLHAGDAIDVELSIGRESIKARARAVWTSDGSRRPRGIGARFDEPSSRVIKAALDTIAPRAVPRHAFQLDVDLERAGGKKERFTCKTFDVSEAGCYLVTDQPFSVGEKLHVTLHLVDEPVSVKGEVVWCGDGKQAPPGIGVRFERRSPEVAAQLRSMKARSEMPPAMPQTAIEASEPES